MGTFKCHTTQKCAPWPPHASRAKTRLKPTQTRRPPIKPDKTTRTKPDKTQQRQTRPRGPCERARPNKHRGMRARAKATPRGFVTTRPRARARPRTQIACARPQIICLVNPSKSACLKISTSYLRWRYGTWRNGSQPAANRRNGSHRPQLQSTIVAGW